jgi:hypothetical protein
MAHRARLTVQFRLVIKRACRIILSRRAPFSFKHHRPASKKKFNQNLSTTIQQDRAALFYWVTHAIFVRNPFQIKYQRDFKKATRQRRMTIPVPS